MCRLDVGDGHPDDLRKPRARRGQDKHNSGEIAAPFALGVEFACRGDKRADVGVGQDLRLSRYRRGRVHGRQAVLDGVPGGRRQPRLLASRRGVQGRLEVVHDPLR